MTEKTLTSYCGLYCIDCVPSAKELFDTLRSFEEALNKTQFEKYARVKSYKIQAFQKYDDFKEVLSAIKNLECKCPCRENGGFAGCRISSCAVMKGYEGCWECDNYRSCSLLSPIKKVHLGLDSNLDLIKQLGVECWSSKRGKHYSWSKEP